MKRATIDNGRAQLICWSEQGRMGTFLPLLAPMLRRLRHVLLAICLCMQGAAAIAQERIKLVNILALSGRMYSGTAQQRHDISVRLAVEEINEHGGVLGKKIELIELDSQSTALGARTAVQEAVRLRPVAVIGERASSLSLVMAPLLQMAGIPMISPNSSHMDVTRTGNYIFRMCYVDRDQASAMADFAYAKLNARTAAILTNVSQKYSEEMTHYFRQRFAAKGGKVLMLGVYMQGASDYSALIEQIRTARPDVIFLPGYAKDSGLLIRQARQLGVRAVFLGGDAWGSVIPDYAGRAIDGSYRTANWQRSDPSTHSQDFVRRFEQRFGFETSEGQVLSYDAVYLLVDAIRRAASIEGAKVRDAMAATAGLNLVAGQVRFDRERNVSRPIVIVRYDKEQMVYVHSIAP